MAKNEIELWKAHPEIDKLEVSSFGRVRSVKGHYYKSSPDHGGYLIVCFRMNGKLVTKKVHRLVAETFIPNLNSLPMINHKDCNRANNNVENLEWCDGSYNVQYREKYGEALGHPVFAINLYTLEVSRFPSQIRAGRELGVFQQNINAVIKGKRKQTHGFWFVNDDENASDAIKRKSEEVLNLERGLS